MFDKLKRFMITLNQAGIPIPLLRDPKTQMASVSLTMLVISFLVVLVGLVGKLSKIFDVDTTQSIYWFLICSSLYFGRNLTGNLTGNSNNSNLNTNESENK